MAQHVAHNVSLPFLLTLLLLAPPWANSWVPAGGDVHQLYERDDGSERSVSSAMDVGWEFRPLERLKRETDRTKTKEKTAELIDRSSSSDDDDLPMGTIPPDYEKEAEDDNKSTEHRYYNMSIISASKLSPGEFLSKYYVDMEKWLNTTGVQGSKEHEHLKGSYRKAASVKFRFKFPFYGHRLNNVTIATGGFCYVGEHTHSWLAATQYIAPLMANFETYSATGALGNSSITYGDDGEKMIIEWNRVSLRDNKQAGEFTFQTHLFSSGDMWFVYKDVPMSIQNISDMQHPCKLGISDAYLFNHRVSQGDKTSLLQPTTRRVIHEYHRITVQPDDVQSGTVIVLTALPTCLNFTSCHDCTNAQLKHFQCSWCQPAPSSGDGMPEAGDSTPFCSDQIGLNRRRQEWVEGNCAVEKKDQYCEIVPPHDATNQSSTTPNPSEARSSAGTPSSQSHPDEIKTLPVGKDGVKREKGGEDGKSGGGGTAFFTVLALVAIGCVGWVLYAFYNPHTTSGQMLIKYRPSKWQIPSSHVRYSANMHM